jgi:hypothetical protein
MVWYGLGAPVWLPGGFHPFCFSRCGSYAWGPPYLYEAEQQRESGGGGEGREEGATWHRLAGGAARRALLQGVHVQFMPLVRIMA